MSQSQVKNNVHIVFSTLNRHPFIENPIADHLYTYIGGMCNELESPVLRVGGHKNHVHILCRLSKKISLSHFVEKIKSNSFRWMKHQAESLKKFSWQQGYAAFSVGVSDLESMIAYIANQEKHHQSQNIGFKEELRTLLSVHGIEYKEEYLWG